MDFDRKFSDVAWSNFVAALNSESPKLEAVVKSIHKPTDALLGAYKDLLLKRGLDAAEGAQLDGIGDIVGQPRYIDEAVYTYFFGFLGQTATVGFGQARIRKPWEVAAGSSARLNDEEYRKVLHWKIAVNNGHGTTPEIASALRGIFDIENVRIKDGGNAKLIIWIDKIPNAADPLLTNARRWVPKLAGVGISVFLGSSGKPFGFKEQGFYSFGEGSFTVEI